jgi:transcriptional regulator with XRE-family HTH domain
MYLSHETVSAHCRKRGLTLQELFRAAGVSSNAYYSLVRKDSVLPTTLTKLASALDVPVSSLTVDEALLLEKQRQLLSEVDRIHQTDPELDRDTIRHTLLLLDEPPLDRLRRALTLGRIGHSR